MPFVFLVHSIFQFHEIFLRQLYDGIQLLYGVFISVDIIKCTFIMLKLKLYNCTC